MTKDILYCHSKTIAVYNYSIYSELENNLTSNAGPVLHHKMLFISVLSPHPLKKYLKYL